MRTAIESGTLLSAPIEDTVRTTASGDALISQGSIKGPDYRRAWQDVVNRTLLMWLDGPPELEDHGIDPPDGTILRLALDYAEVLRDKGQPPPDRILPDPNGGLVFERRENGVTEILHVWEDGTVECQQFQGTRLVERLPM